MVVLPGLKSRVSSTFSTAHSRSKYREKRPFLAHFRLTPPPPGGNLASFLLPFFGKTPSHSSATWTRRSNN